MVPNVAKLLAGPLQGKFLHQSNTFYKEDSSAVQIAEKLSPGCPFLLSMFLDQSCPWCLSLFPFLSTLPFVPLLDWVSSTLMHSFSVLTIRVSRFLLGTVCLMLNFRTLLCHPPQEAVGWVFSFHVITKHPHSSLSCLYSKELIIYVPLYII